MPVIIPVFVPQEGCPQRCLYCHEVKAADAPPTVVTEAHLRKIVAACLRKGCRERGVLQIAFYGGNFTGMARERQQTLLAMANGLIDEGLVESIRISTRPDYITEADLDFLKKFRVRTVEIGVQSLVDEVLRISRRGHTAAQVRQALALLNGRGFETGVHLMAGLPGDTPAGFEKSVREVIALGPHTVRIHPTLVFAGTELAALWEAGAYQPLTLPEAIAAGKYALCAFTAADIPVIRLGLQTTPEMEKPGVIVAGPYHPAFRSLVEEAIFLDLASTLLTQRDVEGREIVFSLAPQDISSFRGHKNGNMQALKNIFRLKSLALSPNPGQPRGSLVLA